MTTRNTLAAVLVLAVVGVLAPLSAQSPVTPQPPAQNNVAPPIPAEVPSNAERWTILRAGNPAGVEAHWRTSDGVEHYFYQFNDRGRGPKIFTNLLLSPAGSITWLESTGNDYFKGPVDERFSVENGTARWSSAEEKGEKPVTDNAYYQALNSAEDSGVFVRALLKAGGKLPLLPEGESGIQRVLDREVSAAGKSQKAVLYAISGLDIAPVYVWMDGDNNFLAAGGSWQMVVREGWESVAPTLIEVQTAEVGKRARQLAQQLAHQVSGPLVFRNANVFDADKAQLRKNQDVVISGNHIQSVTATGKAKLPANAQVIDATGQTLLPGLWDMHAHVADNDGMLNLAAGVTTVRDLGNNVEELMARKKRIEAGEEIGTRIVPAILIDGPGPFQGPTKDLVSNEAEARAAVQKAAGLGYVQVKIYSSVKPELVPVLIDEAHKHGMRVSGHIPATMTAAQCVKLGYDEIQHANFLVLNFMPDVKETRTPARFTEPARRAADIDVKSPEAQEFIRLLKEHHTALDPTLAIFEDMLTARPGKIPEGMKLVANRLPAQTRRGLLNSGLPVPEGMDQRYRDSFANILRLIKAMHDAGIPIESGTDNFAGFTLLRELELHVQLGMSAPEVLQAATLGGARIMHRDSELGSIAPGKLADVVMVNGDPTANISDMRKAALVVKDGVVYRPAELYEALGIRAQ